MPLLSLRKSWKQVHHPALDYYLFHVYYVCLYKCINTFATLCVENDIGLGTLTG